LKKNNYFLEEGETPVSVKENKKSKREFFKIKRSAYYEVTDKCNLKCKFCYANPRTVSERIEGDISLAKKIIDKARLLNIDHLTISGGEPLLRKDIFEIIKYAKKRIDEVLMVTNGVLIDQTAAHKLMETGIDVISISIESSHKDIHEELRGEGTYEKVLTAIDCLKRAGFSKKSINIVATINRKNFHVLHEFSQFAEDLDVNMNFSSFSPVGRGKLQDDLALTVEQYVRFVINSNEKGVAEIKENAVGKKDHSSDCTACSKLVPSLKNSCGIVERSLAIKSNGDLVPCHLFFASDDPEMIIGSILDTSIEDKLWGFYDRVVPTVDGKEGCKDCNVRYFCGGPCYAPGYFKDGRLNTPHPYCERYKLYFSALVDALGSKNEFEAFRENISKMLHERRSLSSQGGSI
jgi:radical SAM protein with 4Fe4S-binding SPASM domain